MSRFLSLFLVFGFVTLCPGQSNPFAKIKYDSVVAYNFALQGRWKPSLLKKDSTLDESTVLPGKKLTPSQVTELIKTLTSTNTYGGPAFACFEPKHAFAFYRKRKIVALIDICFACNNIRSTPKIPAVMSHVVPNDSIPKQNWGFSRPGVNQLMKFCRKLGLETPEVVGQPPW